MTTAGDYTATLPRKRMGSGVLFTDDTGRVLLVEPVYKDYWEIPDESPYEAAAVRAKVAGATAYLENGRPVS